MNVIWKNYRKNPPTSNGIYCVEIHNTETGDIQYRVLRWNNEAGAFFNANTDYYVDLFPSATHTVTYCKWPYNAGIGSLFDEYK